MKELKPSKRPTEKQLNRIKKMVAGLGKQRVEDYLQKYYPFSDLNDMTRKEAQKIITGLSAFMPHKPIYGVRPIWDTQTD